MRIVVIVLLVLLALMTLAAYACCVIAGEADRRAEEMAKKHKESKDE